ncbi:MAG: hypothetical protein O9264_07960 [Leptospira sp.]|nr:hypothetical protein [Leptospira sp.]
MDKNKIISDIRDVFPTLDSFLMENGNKRINEEIDPWTKSNHMFVYQNKLFLNSEQMKVIKKYTFNLKAEKEQDYFFIQNESGNKDRVIWVNSNDYQSMHKQKDETEKWDQDREEKVRRIDKQIEDWKKIKKIIQPSTIKIPAKSFEITLERNKDSDRIDVLLKILEDYGIELLSSNTQSTNSWHAWLLTGEKSFFSFGFSSLDGVKSD